MAWILTQTFKNYLVVISDEVAWMLWTAALVGIRLLVEASSSQPHNSRLKDADPMDRGRRRASARFRSILVLIVADTVGPEAETETVHLMPPWELRALDYT